jgi:hypothetical protein
MAKYKLEPCSESSESGIPGYWGTALKNSQYFPINEKDEEVLKHLKDIRLKPVENHRLNFTLEFEFAPNEFLTDTVLTKTYFHNEDDETIEKTTGSAINWTSQEKNPRVEIKNKKIKKGKKVETKRTETIVPSFFDLFADQIKEDVLPDEGGFWKEDFFASSIEYYLGIIEDYGEGEDEEGEDEDEEPEEDEEEIDKKAGKKKAKAPKKEGGADPKNNEKCKNQ